MVLPLLSAIGSIAGAGGGIMSSIFGARAQDEANKTNWAINLYNQQQQERARNDAIAYAEKAGAEQKLGATDSEGTRTYFKPGVGWVTELGHRPRYVEDYFYNQELPELQSKFKRDVARGEASDDQAGQILAEFKRVQKQDPKQIEDLLYSIAARDIGKSASDTLEPAMQTSLRTGGGSTGAIADAVARAGMDERVKAGQNAKLQSMDYTQGKYDQERNGLSQLYQLFAGQAGQQLNPSMIPGAGPAGASAMMGQFAGNAQQGQTMMANAINQPTGQLAPREANNSQANMWGGIGSSVAGLGDRLSSMGDRNSMNSMLMNYLSQGGQLSMNNGGIMDLMTNRIRSGGGLY